jgi:hypothetical protein
MMNKNIGQEAFMERADTAVLMFFACLIIFILGGIFLVPY